MIQDKKTKEIKIINEDYKNNKNKVVNFLFESVLTVHIGVPDVVKGNFEERINY